MATATFTAPLRGYRRKCLVTSFDELLRLFRGDVRVAASSIPADVRIVELAATPSGLRIAIDSPSFDLVPVSDPYPEMRLALCRNDEPATPSNSCRCGIMQLMARGCQCGGV